MRKKFLVIKEENRIKLDPKGIGNMIVTSISKIRKITVTIKNRSEKGVRILWDGSNPHSKDLNFSYFIFIFWGLSRIDSDSRIKITISTNEINDKIIIIRYSLVNLLIGN